MEKNDYQTLKDKLWVFPRLRDRLRVFEGMLVYASVAQGDYRDSAFDNLMRLAYELNEYSLLVSKVNDHDNCQDLSLVKPNGGASHE